jgi:hypothetical protein
VIRHEWSFWETYEAHVGLDAYDEDMRIRRREAEKK